MMKLLIGKIMVNIVGKKTNNVGKKTNIVGKKTNIVGMKMNIVGILGCLLLSAVPVFAQSAVCIPLSAVGIPQSAAGIPQLAVSAPKNVVSDSQTRSITMSMGLPSNAVRNIVQDKDGFIWFGTDNGLCRYDGYSVQVFTNPHTKLDQYVSALARCDEGLLVGTPRGAYVLDFQQKNFLCMSDKIKSVVTDFALDGDQNVWIATESQGVFCYNLKSHKCKNYPLKAFRGRADAILVDATNQVWALTNAKLSGAHAASAKLNGTHAASAELNGAHAASANAASAAVSGLARLDKHTGTFKPLPLHGDAMQLCGMSMLDMQDGSVMVGSWDQGLFQVSMDGSVKMLLSSMLTNSLRHVHHLYNDRGRFVLIGSDDGLVEYDLKKQTWRMLSEVWDPSRSTMERFVYGIAGDREGGLWVGTFYGGVSYIPPQSFENRFAAYKPSVGGLRGSVVSRIVEDSHRRIWLATDDAGLECLDPATNQVVDYPGRAVIGSLNVHAIWPEGDDLWVGTYGNGIIRLNTQTGAMQTYHTDGRQEGSSCYTIFRDHRGRLWANSLGRVNLWNEQAQQFRPVGPVKACVIDVDEDREGNIWFATQGSGLWCYRRNNIWKQYKHVEGDSTTVGSNQVNCLRIARRGTLYVATSHGVSAYQPTTDNFRRIPVFAPTQEFCSIIAAEGEMWLSSTKGLVRYTPEGNVQVFNQHDGLTSDVFMPNSGIISSTGRIYFGTSRGLNAFFPDDVVLNQVPPPVAIVSIDFFGRDPEDLEVDDETENILYRDWDSDGDVESGEVDASDVELASSETNVRPMFLNHVKEIHLEHDENMFAITFAALSFVSPEKNVYCCKMEGVDRKWFFTHSNRTAYTNLSPGTYTFRVKATNNDGVWSKQEARLKIVVHPPLWWSMPAKLLYLFVFCMLFYWLMTLRLKRAEKRHQEELSRREEEWQRLSLAYTGQSDVPSFRVALTESAEAKGGEDSLADGSQTGVSLTDGSQTGVSLTDGWMNRSKAYHGKGKTVNEVLGLGYNKNDAEKAKAGLGRVAGLDNMGLGNMGLGNMGLGYGKVGAMGERVLSEADAKFLERLMQIVEDHMADPGLNVAFVADKLGMGRSSLFLKLKGMANITPNDLMMLVRLRRAAALLREGKYQVTEISYRCGFSSPSYFGKCFHKQFGVRPTEYGNRNETES